MNLPSALSVLRSPAALPTTGSAAIQPADGVGFAAVLQGESVQTSAVRGHRDLPGYGRVETLTVTETTVGPDGKPVHTVKELAVCPECGTANCACLSRVTLQARLDEENAQGPRDKEQPKPFAVLPQTFNQMSANFHAAQGSSPPRMFG